METVPSFARVAHRPGEVLHRGRVTDVTWQQKGFRLVTLSELLPPA